MPVRLNAQPKLSGAWFVVAMLVFALCFLAPLGFAVIALENGTSALPTRVLVVYDAIFALFFALAIALNKRGRPDQSFTMSALCVFAMLVIPFAW